MMHVNPTPTNPVTQNEIAAEVVFTLYDKGILTKKQLSKSMLKLRIKPNQMARAFGYDTVSDFLAEFVQTAEEREVEEANANGWKAWTRDEVFELADLLYYDKCNSRQISEIMIKNNPARTAKSVSGFISRTWTYGNRVDQAVWDLIEEGYTPDEISDAGYNSWRSEFTLMLYDLKKYAARMGYPAPKIVFVK